MMRMTDSCPQSLQTMRFSPHGCRLSSSRSRSLSSAGWPVPGLRSSTLCEPHLAQLHGPVGRSFQNMFVSRQEFGIRAEAAHPCGQLRLAAGGDVQDQAAVRRFLKLLRIRPDALAHIVRRASSGSAKRGTMRATAAGPPAPASVPPKKLRNPLMVSPPLMC